MGRHGSPTERGTLFGVPITHEIILALLLVAEVVIFCAIGTNFRSRENAFEVLRLSVEIGLLALAMTPVIVTGGIDLSAGSLLGLTAVLFGKLWRDGLTLSLFGTTWATGPLPLGQAAVATLALGAAAGGLNALLITRLRIPPLIVTLGSFSLFRGLAEGITRGVDNFTGFPEGFLFLGQGYLFQVIPTQVPLFLAAALGFWVLLQRTSFGRGLYAIGFSPEGARYAGIPVERRLTLVYVLSGLAAGLAAIIYVAHLGQAKADAGTGYELMAITAVVLGGTSIFGGRGTIQGTVLGLLAIVILQRGLRLADLPAELAGVLTGVLLLATIILDQLSARLSPSPQPLSPGGREAPAEPLSPQGRGAPAEPLSPQGRGAPAEPLSPPGRGVGVRGAAPARSTHEEFVVKNSQVAILCTVILAAALIVAGSNWYLVQALRPPAPAKPITVAMMPKSKGNAYFKACRRGAEEAARELGVNLIWDGPTDPDPAKQNEVVEAWITRGVDVIAAAVENREGMATVLRKARARGIKVVTWDADTEPEARDFLVNQATPEGIGQTLMDTAAKVMGGKGEFAIITASLTAANMIEWQKHIEARRAAKYPDIKMAVLRPCDDLQSKAFDEANTILNAYPNVKLIMAICSPAVPGAAEAVKQSGRKDVKVIGLGLPSDNKRYVHEGVTDSVILWNTMDLGYLTVYAAHALKAGTLKPGATSMPAGRLGTIAIQGDNILLGKPTVFTKDNIDQFDF